MPAFSLGAENIFFTISNPARRIGKKVYLVCGITRNILLNKPNFDTGKI